MRLQSADCRAITGRRKDGKILEPEVSRALAAWQEVNLELRSPTIHHTERRCLPPRSPRPWAAALALVSVLMLCAAGAKPAGAQESAQVLASRALFEEGRKLMTEGRFAEACVKLEESQNLRSGIGTQFNLAECYEKTGRTASAWSLYLRVASETKALGQAEREQVARSRAAALEPRLSRLTIEVPSPAPGLEIELDGAKMTAGTWGVATPLDPGDHELVARAPGFQSWTGVARVAEAAADAKISVPALIPAPRATDRVPSGVSQPVLATADERADDGGADGNRTLPYVIGGVGAAGVVIGGLFGLSVLDKNGEAKKICADRPTACQRTEIERHAELTRDARRARAAGFVSLGLGLIGLGISAAWLLDTDEPESSQAPVELAVDAHSAGISMRGTF